MERKKSFFTHLSILLGVTGVLALQLLESYDASQRSKRTSTEMDRNYSKLADPISDAGALNQKEGIRGEAPRLPGWASGSPGEVGVSTPTIPRAQR